MQFEGPSRIFPFNCRVLVDEALITHFFHWSRFDVNCEFGEPFKTVTLLEAMKVGHKKYCSSGVGPGWAPTEVRSAALLLLVSDHCVSGQWYMDSMKYQIKSIIQGRCNSQTIKNNFREELGFWTKWMTFEAVSLWFVVGRHKYTAHFAVVLRSRYCMVLIGTTCLPNLHLKVIESAVIHEAMDLGGKSAEHGS